MHNFKNDSKQSFLKYRFDSMTEKPVYINGSNYEAESSIRFMPSLIAESPLIL
jgi:hypothetical protein